MNASSSCRSSSRARSRSPPLRTSAPTCAWPSSTWHLPRHLHRLSSSLSPTSHLHPSRPLGLQPRVLNRTPRGARLVVAVAGDVVAAVAKAARTAAHQVVPRGPPSSTRGPGPFTCGPGLLPVALAVHLSASARLHRSSCSSTLWWPACLQPTTLRLLGHTTRCPPRRLILPGRQHHLRRLLLGHLGTLSPSPTPSAPSPSPHHRTPRTG